MRRKMSLILTNPATRKHTELPFGTIAGLIDVFYSLAFCKEANTYKIVGLLYKKSGHIGCEIMSIITREWKTIDDPSSDLLQSLDIYQKPVSIAGLLLWMPRRNGCDLVYMNVDHEKFVTKKLPTVCTENDRLVETGGFLGLVTHATNHMMEVWILRTGGDLKENWIKRFSINLVNFECAYPTAICSPRNGKEMVFGCIHQSLYVYNFDKGENKLVYSKDDGDLWYNDGGVYLPHRNMLTSWENPFIVKLHAEV